MKNKELQERLAQYPDDAEVVPMMWDESKGARYEAPLWDVQLSECDHSGRSVIEIEVDG